MIIFNLRSESSIFISSFYDLRNKKLYTFEISSEKNELEQLREYTELNRNKLLIGFNILEYAYPLLHKIIGGSMSSTEIYYEAKKLYGAENRYENIVPRQNSKFKILDLYKMHHFDKDGGRVGLRDVQIKLQLEDVSEPLSYDETDYIDKIRNALKNDARALYLLCKDSKEDIELRNIVSKEIGLDVRSFNSTRMGESIFLKFIQNKDGTKRKDLVSSATSSTHIDLEECLFDIEFKTKPFKALYEYFRGKKVNVDDKIFEKVKIKDAVEIADYSIFKKGKMDQLNIVSNELRINLGEGGIHASVEPGIYNSCSEYVIYDDDAKSYYPSISIRNGLHPRHIDEELFCSTYKSIYDARESFDADNSFRGILKRCLVSVFGKTKMRGSPFYDPKMFLTGTLNGQLMLLKYIEMLSEIEGFKLLQANTDGITYMIPRPTSTSASEIRTKWESMFGIVMESIEVKQATIKDVNNILYIDINDSIKAIGIFRYCRDYTKSQSSLIVPFALYRYFIFGESIEETVTNHDNIFDFCIIKKFTKGFGGELHSIKDGKIHIERTQKMIRYIITKTGKYLNRRNSKDKVELITNEKVTIVNNAKGFNAKDIDRRYYVNEANKIRNAIVQKKQKFILR